MSTDLYAVYCYDCDEYVLNDTDVHKVRRLRDELMDEDSEAESLASSSVKSFSHESSSGESSDSGWADEPAIRQLRPRKRTISGDSDAKRRKVRVLSRESKVRSLFPDNFPSIIVLDKYFYFYSFAADHRYDKYRELMFYECGIDCIALCSQIRSLYLCPAMLRGKV